ncbi:glutathione S-transferase family protein [Actibacterium sp. 188UL27-1]|uniref:glutathione S-transferase family protein n=1 Tax=Actibacterium sp. 188UL27-1 TaxID=2786961 RepID=UPI00195B05C9|nr:glutathione S-transferase [Actibacterium sp. 188UL27-1]MBM7070059.1 glutathione S-transferase [Actibacterium sp. 188UL27-1]
MIDIHCLKYSRAVRVVWLMENLGQPYNLIEYPRTEAFRAPPELSEVHDLGKSPVIKDGDLTLAESGTILRYLAHKHGDTSHQPNAGTQDFWRHEELLDYVESSFADAAMGVLLPAMTGDAPSREAKHRFQMHADHLMRDLPPEGLLFAERVMLADIQFSYLLANLSSLDALSAHPRLERYWSDMQRQPGYLAAIANAGPMAPEKSTILENH